MSALMSTFQMEAKGDAFIDADVRQELDAANAPQYNTTAPRIDPMMTVRQVAEPGQQSANQPQMDSKQVNAVRELKDLTSKGISTGTALNADAGAQMGANRVKSVQDTSKQLSAKVDQLKTVIGGADQPKDSAKGSFGRAALGQGVALAAAAGATMAAGPAVGATVAAVATGYDVAKAFRGEQQETSSFASPADPKGKGGYVSAPASQPTAMAAPVSTAFMSGMSNTFGVANVNLAEDSLVGMKKPGALDVASMPKLENTNAARLLMGALDNGAQAMRNDGKELGADKENLAFSAPKLPNPGVMMPAAPKPFFA